MNSKKLSEKSEFKNDLINKAATELTKHTVHREGILFPSARSVSETIRKLRVVIFNEVHGNADIKALLCDVYDILESEAEIAIVARKNSHRDANANDPGIKSAREIIKAFIEELTDIREKLIKDAQAGFEGDPAAKSCEEVMLSYPGMFAVFVYRIAHSLHIKGLPFIPRMMTEYAHSKTGIDIHPGADIGEYFFIDHGTSVVIGESTVIGNHVKLYQGVTLGALSTKKGQKQAGFKRHPTIEDNVTIYAGATILGGDTLIGKNSVIGGNVFVTKSVPRDTKVKLNSVL